MMYIHTGELARLRKDVGAFVEGALAARLAERAANGGPPPAR